MEVAQNGRHAAHVIVMGVGERNGVETADAVGPQDGGDDFFADVEIGLGCVSRGREEAQSSRIDEQGFAFRGDEQERVALADINGFEEECVVRMVDGARPETYEGDEHHSRKGEMAPKAWGARELDGQDEEQKGCAHLNRGRLWNAEIAQRERSQFANQEDAQMEDGEADPGGKNRAGWPQAQQDQENHGGWKQDGEQGKNAEIHRQGVDGEAVEVDGHGQRERQFDDRGHEEEFAKAQEAADEEREKPPRDAATGGGFEMARDEAQGDAELCDFGWELWVNGDEAQILRGFEAGVQGALEQRNGDPGDGGDGEHGHLQTGVEDAARTAGGEAEGGESDDVERAAVAVEQTAEQVEGDHPKRTLRGDGEAGEKRVGEGDGEGDCGSRQARDTQAAG